MFSRRLVDDLRRQNWTTVAIEIFVLTLGVFLGLQAENWSQNRKDRAELRAYTERLIRDFSAIRDRSKQSVAETDRELEALSQISVLTHGNGTVSDVNYSALIQELRGYIVPHPRAASYLDMLESNDLGLFQDFSISDALIRCDDSMQRNLSGFETRRQFERDYSEVLLGLVFDNEYLSFEEAFLVVDTEARTFRRELALLRMNRQADKIGFEDIIDCSTQVIEKLTSSD